MAHDFGGFTFYEYHRMFSARAASLLQSYSTKLDWSYRDNDLFTKLFAGRRALACSICGSLAHDTGFCPLTQDANSQAYSNPNHKQVRGNTPGASGRYQSGARSQGSGDRDQHGRTRKYANGSELCNNFNEEGKGCTRNPCTYSHSCSMCYSSGHGKPSCTKKLPAGQKPTTPGNNPKRPGKAGLSNLS